MTYAINETTKEANQQNQVTKHTLMTVETQCLFFCKAVNDVKTASSYPQINLNVTTQNIGAVIDEITWQVNKK